MQEEQLSTEQLLLEIERLRQEVQDLKRDKADLEILLENTIEHSDTVEAQLQNQADQAVRESEKRLAQFLEAVPVGVFVVDTSGKPYYANQTAQKLLGKGIASEATAKQLADIYQVYIAGTNQLYPNAQLPLVQALRGESQTVDDMEIHQGDRTISLEARATPIFDEKGEIVYAIAAFQDITERKQAEKSLQQQKQQYLDIFEATTDGLIINTLDGQIAEANPAACAMHGYSHAEFIGLDPKNFIHPDYHHLFDQFLEETYYQKKPFAGQAVDIRKDGTAIAVEVRGTAFTYKGQPHILGVVRDITKRKQAETQLRLAQERDRVLAEITLRIRQSLDLEQILNTTVVEVRQFLQADRVCLCYVDQNWQTKVVAESVVPERQSIIGITIANPTFSRDMMANFEQGVRAINDLSEEEMIPVSAQILQQLQVKACLGVPILLGSSSQTGRQFLPNLDQSDHYFDNQGFWLLVAHQCSGAREWQCLEIDLLEQLGNQVAIAIQQAKLYQQLAALNANNEASLRESEERLRTLINATPDIICFKDGAGRWLESNQANLEFLELEGVDYRGKTDAELSQFSSFYQEALLGCYNTDEQAWEHGSTYRVEETVPRPDGTVSIWDMIKAPLFHSDGRRKALVVLGRDISDRKRVEEALRAREAQYRDLVETANCIILRWDTDGNIRFMNDYGQRLFGFASSEILGRNVVGTIVPETETSGRDLQALMVDICQHPEKYLLNENENLCKNGERVWIVWANKPILDQQGNLVEILSVGTDMTKRKRVEEALQQSELKFRTIVENANDVLFVINPEGIFSYVSPNVFNIMGYEPAEMEGDPFMPLIYLDDLPKCLDAVNRVVAKGERQSGIEYRVRHKDGSYHWHSANIAPSQDANGNLIVVGIARDITERKQAESALQQSELKFRTIVENANDIIYIHTLEAVLTYVSPNVTSMLGYSVAEMEGKYYVPLIHPDDIAISFGAVRKAAESGERQSGQDAIRLKHKDGSWRCFNCNLSPVQDANGNISILGIARDITERKQAEEALHRSELKYRNIFENSQVGIGRTRLEDGLILDANQRFADLLGFGSAADVIGKRFATEFYVNPDDRQQILAQVSQHNEVSNFELQLRPPNGSIIWVLLSFRLNPEEGCLDFVMADISARKHLEEELLQSQRFLDSVIENIPLALFAKDVTKDFRYVLVNKSFEKIFGFSKETAIGLTDYDLISQEQADYYRAQDLAVVANEGTLLEIPEQAIPRDDDQKLLAHIWKFPLFNTQGSATHLLCIAEDITERKHREQALRLIMEGTAAKTGDEFFQSCVRYLAQVLQVRYALLSECVDQAKTRAQTLAVWGGEGIGENFEYSVLGTPCENVLMGKTSYYPESIQSLFPNDPDLVAIGAESYLGVPLTDSAGNRLGTLAVLDLKPMEPDPGRELILKIFAARAGAELERKQADQALQRRFQAESLLSSISRQFIDQDVDTAINFTLSAIAQFFGTERSCIFEYSEDQSQYHIIHEWCDPGLEPLSFQARTTNVEVFPLFNSLILSGNAFQIPNLAELPPEIAERKVFEAQSIQSVVAIPMTHAGKVVGFLGMDVVRFSKTWSQEEIALLKLVGELIAIGRARHKAESALRVAKEAAEAANRAKSAFLANMSHELRTPLNAILGFAQLMERDDGLTPRQQESLAIINRSGEHLLNLINDVLEMSKIEAGRITLNPEPFDLHRLLETLEEMFQIRAKAKGLSLQFEIAPELPLGVVTDEGKLRQVLINLLSNAVKFTDSGGVKLRARAQKSRGAGEDLSCQIPYTLYFEVEDTGRGIAPEEMEELFQPFVQTTSGTQAREGTGLGLTISRQFVQLMGGDIYLTSTVSQGSTFGFDVQVTLAEPPEAVVQQTARGRVLRLAPNQPLCRVLVVDDRLENRQLIEQLLQTVGFETRMAVDGQEAIAQWEVWHPHLILMDMRMPVMDGYEATRRIRILEKLQAKSLKQQKTAIIALTASAFEEQRANIIAAGCNDLVRKPFQEQVLFDKMAEHLGLQYVYQEKDVDAIAASRRVVGSRKDEKITSDFILQPSSLQVMPTEWIAELHQAATRVNAKLIMQLLEQIPEEYTPLAQALQDLVDNYRFDTIIDLFQSLNFKS